MSHYKRDNLPIMDVHCALYREAPLVLEISWGVLVYVCSEIYHQSELNSVASTPVSRNSEGTGNTSAVWCSVIRPLWLKVDCSRDTNQRRKNSLIIFTRSTKVTIQLCKTTLREVQHVMTPCSHVQQGKNKAFHLCLSVCRQNILLTCFQQVS